MIRGCLGRATLVALLLAVVAASSFENIEITKAQRTVTLSGAYAGENIKVSFVANDDDITHFTYLVPLQYDEAISKIWFSKSEKDKRPLAYAKSIFSYEGQTYGKYRVTLPHKYHVGDIGEVYTHIVYLYRYVNLPTSITLMEDQKLQYEDIKFIVSPYHVLEQDSTYKFARLFENDPDGSKRGSGEVQFSKASLEPFTHVKHNVFGVNNNPQIQFTSVEKVIEISHWGNIGITENYKIINKGPSLRGEFSRVTFGSKGHDIRTAFKGIDFELPYEIWGLYYLDEVGNISTSRAWRDDSSNSVRMSLMPRFALLGGWKSNWEIGYNLNTNGHLFHNANKFEVKNVKLEYALERILSEEFKIKVVLPEGAENVKINIGGVVYDSSSLQVVKTTGYLDFQGRPTYVISNYHGSSQGKNIEVTYDFPQGMVYHKPILLSLTVLGLLCCAIFLKRFKLQAFAEIKQD